MNHKLVYGVRYKDGEFQLRCDACKAASQGGCYWPLTLDFWDPDKGMSRCRACWYTYQRMRMASIRAADPEVQRKRRQKYYRESRDVILLKKKDRYYANHDAILAARREAYRRKRDAAREAVDGQA